MSTERISNEDVKKIINQSSIYHMFNSVECLQKSVESLYQDLFHKYVQLILQWNRKINITSKHNTKARIYDFICEGIAMSQLINNKQSIIVDIGSGAGFPGIVLSILGFENMNLVEINYKKAAFLQYVVAELGLKAKVYNEDIKKVFLPSVDYIISKAVTTSNELLSCSNHIFNEKTQYILCKNLDDGNVGGEATQLILTDRAGIEKQYKFITYFN